MRVIGKKLRGLDGGRVAFFCPGCKTHHQVTVDPAQSGPVWGYNGNPDAPTFTPSVLRRWISGDPPVTAENLDAYKANPWTQKDKENVCHSFVTDGRIQFLGDCTHVLAGQTVDLPDLPDLAAEGLA